MTNVTNGNLECFIEAWGAPYVARTQVGRFSGYVLNSRTMANLDSLGKGPKGRIRIGKKVAYKVEDLVEWMQERAAGCDKASKKGE